MLQRLTGLQIRPPFALSQKVRQALMIKTLIEGEALLDWLKVPWADHVAGYQQAGVPFVRYEDLLTNPEQECLRLLRILNIDRPPTAIRTAIKRHEFNREKARFTRARERTKAQHLRRGQAGDWRNHLTLEQQALLAWHFSDLLRQFKYPTATSHTASQPLHVRSLSTDMSQS